MTQNMSEKNRQPVTLRNRMRNRGNRFIDWVWKDPGAVDNVQDSVRGFLRVFFILFREIGRDRLSLRASALTFTVVLSLVPMLALGTAVLKGLGAGDQMRTAAYKFIEQLEEPDLRLEKNFLPPVITEEEYLSQEALPPTEQDITEDASVESPGSNMAESVENTDTGPLLTPENQATASAPNEPEALAEEAAVDSSMTAHLRRAVDQLFDYVDRTDFAALGAFGIFGVIIAAISVLGTIEAAMNSIWQVDSNRPFGRKVIDYLALMILLPVTVNFTLATETTLHSPVLLGRLHAFLPVVWLGAFLLKILPILALVATFVILYRFLPNMRVEFFPAVAGGLFGGISWLLVQIVYLKLQIGVARYNAIYGSFATLPLFLLWIYVAWLVFLAGAEMAFAVQVRRHYLWKEIDLTPVARMALAFEIIENVLADFKAGNVSDRTLLARKINQPHAAVCRVIDDLVLAGKLYRVYGKDDGYMPAKPEDAIVPDEFITLFFGADVPDVRNCTLAQDALNGAHAALQGRSIVCKTVDQTEIVTTPDTNTKGDRQ